MFKLNKKMRSLVYLEILNNNLITKVKSYANCVYGNISEEIA